MQSEKEQALERVSGNGLRLADVAPEFRSDPEVVLAAIEQNGLALQHASPEMRGDIQLVTAAVKKNGLALAFASEEARGDREVVETALTEDFRALQHAAASLRGHPDIVMAAVARNFRALEYADDSLLQDQTFAVEARKRFYWFKVVALSGNSCFIAIEPPDTSDYDDDYDADYDDQRETLLDKCCRRLGIVRCGSQALLFGSELVSSSSSYAEIVSWPGSPSLGKVVEYQLVASRG
mmetsp:Transcript_55074/g.101956  ORF Transcript_55074/g.101956 Transcript_55074/m.101956 type:complete len:237 (-) Transcript_55074:20-730(-)